jgi:hypothetical protein
LRYKLKKTINERVETNTENAVRKKRIHIDPASFSLVINGRRRNLYKRIVFKIINAVIGKRSSSRIQLMIVNNTPL